MHFIIIIIIIFIIIIIIIIFSYIQIIKQKNIYFAFKCLFFQSQISDWFLQLLKLANVLLWNKNRLSSSISQTYCINKKTKQKQLKSNQKKPQEIVVALTQIEEKTWVPHNWKFTFYLQQSEMCLFTHGFWKLSEIISYPFFCCTIRQLCI